jgi:hypothetical protein
MSHTAKITTKFARLEPLKSALAVFGWTLVEKAKSRTYSSDEARNKVYDYVAINPATGHNAFDIGIMVKDKELELNGDFFGGSLAQTLGTNLDRLREEYAYRTIEQEYTNLGASVMRNRLENGDQIVEAEGNFVTA